MVAFSNECLTTWLVYHFIFILDSSILELQNHDNILCFFFTGKRCKGQKLHAPWIKTKVIWGCEMTQNFVFKNLRHYSNHWFFMQLLDFYQRYFEAKLDKFSLSEYFQLFYWESYFWIEPKSQKFFIFIIPCTSKCTTNFCDPNQKFSLKNLKNKD